MPMYPLIRTFVERPGNEDLDRGQWGPMQGPVPVSKLPKAFLQLSHP